MSQTLFAGLTPRTAVDVTEAPMGGRPSKPEVEALLQRVGASVETIVSRCFSADTFVAAQLEFSAITDDIEIAFAELHRFCTWLRDIEGQPFEHVERSEVDFLHFACRRLIDAEQGIAYRVHHWLLFLLTCRDDRAALHLFLHQVAVWHDEAKRALESCKASIERRLDAFEARPLFAGIDVAACRLAGHADALVKARNLEAIGAFAELMASDRQRRLELISGTDTQGPSDEVLERLWSVVDLVVIEDLATGDGAGGDSAAGGNGSLLVELSQAPRVGPRFAALAELLDDADAGLTVPDIVLRFATVGGVRAGGQGHAAIWRAVLVGHSSARVRRRAAAIARLEDLWPTFVDPRTPLTTLLVIAEQVAERGGEDCRRTVFDCVKSRLGQALARREHLDIELVRGFLKLFMRFDFFLKTRYFEQIDQLIERFDHQAEDLGLEAFTVESALTHQLEQLPLWVQRHLARRGRYAQIFACHSHSLIAREVIAWIDADNLETFLSLPRVSRQLVESALAKIDLRQHRQLKIRALSHAACPLVFAGKVLEQLTPDELHAVVQAPTTSTEVKRKAMLGLIRSRQERQPGRDKSPSVAAGNDVRNVVMV